MIPMAWTVGQLLSTVVICHTGLKVKILGDSHVPISDPMP